jgi:hypothetical protein
LSGAVAKLAGITFGRLSPSYWIDNLGFITEGKLAAIFIKPSLGVFNWPVIYFINKCQQVFWHHHHHTINKFSSAVAGEEEDFCKGSFARTSFALF